MTTLQPPPIDVRFPALQGTDDIAIAGLRALLPPDRILVSEWADRYRELDERSPEPGRWRTSKVPYMREPMDKLSVIDPCQTVVIMGGAQIAKTECIHNMLGYLITEAPGPTLVVQATVDMGKDWSKDRFQSLVDTCPRLRPLVGGGEWKDKDGDNTLRYKRFPGGSLFVAGANSPSGLRSKPIRYLLLDEVDSYPPSAGKEGDPVQLATRRTSNFSNRKIIMVSTPTLKGESRIAQAYEDSDQRKYFMPCPHCGSMQIMKWENVTWRHTGNPRDAYYACETNGCIIEEYHKPEMLARGEWRATRPDRIGDTCGYHVPGLLSPWRTFAKMAEEFVAAKPPGKPPNLKLLQVFANTVLGEVWDDTGGREVVASEIMAKRYKWWKDETIVVPKKATVVTAGVDVQDDRLEIAVWAWGPGKEAWLVDYRKIFLPPTDAACWDDLAVLLGRTYEHETGVHLPISVACIDTGGHHTDEVLDFCHVNRSRRWYSIKGVSGMHKPIWAGTVLSGTKRHKHRNCFPVGVDGAKSWLFSSMNLDKGRIHFPNTEGMPQDFCDVEFFEQLCVEKRRPKYQDGRQIWYFWKPDHARNEALDTTVYALAGLEALLHAGKKLDRVPDGVPANGWIPKKDVKVLEAPSVPAVTSRRAEPRPPPRGAVAPVRDWLRRNR